MRIVPRKYGDDASKCYYLAVPGNTQMIFNTHIWHSATVFRGDEGQRYSVNRIYGRADHYWEGLDCFTNLGMHAIFRAFIGTLSARQRQYFRFPSPDHAEWTERSLRIAGRRSHKEWHAIVEREDPELAGVLTRNAESGSRTTTIPDLEKTRKLLALVQRQEPAGADVPLMGNRPIDVPPRPETYEEWLRQCSRAPGQG